MTSSSPTKAEDHNTRLITIIISLVTAIVGAPTLYNIISDLFFTPTVIMDFLKPSTTNNTITLEVKNTGNEAATHYSLTIESPYNISNHTLFLTENSTNKNASFLDKKTLQISIPRLVQGPGSLIRLNLNVTTPMTGNITNAKFVAYSTFDQGSSKSEGPLEEQEPKSWTEKLANFWNLFMNRYLSVNIIYGIILTFMIPLIATFIVNFIRRITKKKKNIR